MKRFFVFFLFFLCCLTSFAQEDVWNPTPQLPNNYIGPNKLKDIYVSAGATTTPTYINHGSNVITVNACCVSLYDNAEHIGLPKRYSFGPATFTLNVDATNYIVANYNSGSPVIQCITDVDLINESSVAPILTIYNKGGFLHSLNWDTLGKGLNNKLHQRLVKTERYKHESGLAVSMTNPGTNLRFTISSGLVWYGATRESLLTVDSTTDVVLIVYPNGTTSATTTLNNLNYITTGSVLNTLTNGRYAVNWVYRGIEDAKHCYIMLGVGDYTLNDAQLAQPPAAPAIITSHAQLVSKIIVQKSSNTVTSLQSAFDVQFNLATPLSHNDLTGINDGDVYEHLTISEKDVAINGSETVDLKAKVLNVFNSIKNASGTAANPAYTFSNDPDSGMYSIGQNTVGISVGGAKIYQFTRDDQYGALMTLSSGIASVPAEIQFEVLPNDYMQIGIEGATASTRMTGTLAYTPFIGAYSNRDLTFHSNNLYRGMLSKAGNVLINTTNDDGNSKLQVNGNIKGGQIFLDNGSVTNPAYSFGSDPDTGIYRYGDNEVGISANGQPVLRAFNNRVDLGPNITASATLILGYSPTAALTTIQGLRKDADYNCALSLQADGGNVLIATSTDDGANKLQVNGSARFLDPVSIVAGNGDQFNLDNAGERYTQLNFKNNSAQKAALYYDNTDNFLGFQTNNAERMRIKDDGDVLIGTSVDAGDYKLQVSGNIKCNNSLRLSGNGSYIISDNGATDIEIIAGMDSSGIYYGSGWGTTETTSIYVGSTHRKVIIQGALKTPVRSTPLNPEAGDIYFDDDDDHFYGYNGTTWKQLDN